MGKLLAAGSLALLALLALIWYQLRSPAEASPVVARPQAVQGSAGEAPAPRRAAAAQQALAQIAQAQAGSDKMPLDSDEFFNTFQDVVVQVATRNAMACYTGGLRALSHDPMVRFSVKETIHNGEVSITDVQVAESTIDDKDLIACFAKEIANTHWRNDRFPEYAESDIVVIRPGALVNKFSKEARDYQGSGPDFTKIHPIEARQ